jgi:hypothetical protein
MPKNINFRLGLDSAGNKLIAIQQAGAGSLDNGKAKPGVLFFKSLIGRKKHGLR